MLRFSLETLDAYSIDVAALQEIRWTGIRQIKVGYCVMFFSELTDRHCFGSDFVLHEKLKLCAKEFNTISERMAILKFNTVPQHSFNVYACPDGNE